MLLAVGGIAGIAIGISLDPLLDGDISTVIRGILDVLLAVIILIIGLSNGTTSHLVTIDELREWVNFIRDLSND